MQETSSDITIFLLITTFLIFLMAGFILLILFMHRKKQLAHLEKINQMQTGYEKSILKSQLEMQEQTFRHISQEIHDNISLSLTLAKLNLNTLMLDNKEKAQVKLNSSVELLSQSITQLRDLSKSLDSDLIEKNGLLSAIDEELKRIQRTEYFKVNYMITGTTIYMNSGAELIIFRIIQEAFNNIIKHANANNINLKLHYNDDCLAIQIIDDGRGFDNNCFLSEQAGLKNMDARIKLLGGKMNVKSSIGKGTTLNFNIPLNHDK